MGTEAVHSFHCPQGISGLSLSEDNVLVAQHGQYVSVRASDKAGKWRPLQQLNMYKPVSFQLRPKKYVCFLLPYQP